MAILDWLRLNADPPVSLLGLMKASNRLVW